MSCEVNPFIDELDNKVKSHGNENDEVNAPVHSAKNDFAIKESANEDRLCDKNVLIDRICTENYLIVKDIDIDFNAKEIIAVNEKVKYTNKLCLF